MSYLRTKVVEQAKAWLGYNEADGSHKTIIDVYNSHKPLARGYAVQYDDAWCATFVSAVAVNLGYTAIIPTECSCTRMIELLKKIDSWQESDSYVPRPGDLLLYDWDDNGVGENINSPEHIGIVEKVSGNTITVIEGNYKNAVTRRDIAVNGKYIRGFGVPKYDVEQTVTAPKTETSTNKQSVKASDVKMTQIKRGSKGKAVKVWQAIIDVNVDGIFGPATEAATIAFQKKAFPNYKKEWDGIVGNKTWKAGLESV